MRIMAPGWGFLGLQLALTGVLRASGNMVTTMLITLASTWVIQFPLAYVLSTHTSLGSNGIWWAWQGAGWFLLMLMLVTLTMGVPPIAGHVLAG